MYMEDEGCPVILVCGPKSIGKSTFNRYLMNLLLNRLPCLEYLECDLGQPEFTPPGCISLVNVREPLLGPPFAHQRPPRKMAYYGDASCEHDTERYLDTLKYVFGGYERDIPLLVNTMGWVKGRGGLRPLSQSSSWAPSPSPCPLGRGLLSPGPPWSKGPSGGDTTGGFPLHRREYLNFLCRGLVCQWVNGIARRVVGCPLPSLDDALYVSMLRVGIVRGVDMTNKLYYILTPVAPENLRRVNCLLIGNIAIPNCIFLNQKRGAYELEALPPDLSDPEASLVERFSWRSTLNIASQDPEDEEDAAVEETVPQCENPSCAENQRAVK
ncbi:PREDICTED: polynucleotide 5'-hydroxyl-kinase NOL9-like, partial [Thamnophis sirtalis]|uniref:Polynucleotide 5'-hydroxyl-kinase NOL9-like n=1 Tax=Thamnophis sirtalis TaxID=35019 RepID=A0A6I9Z1J0_9SAUR